MKKHDLRFTALTLRNFLSFGNNVTVVPLNEPGTTLIVGENLDDTTKGITSNGCGKAQPLTSKIKIPGGWTTMEEIQVGDIVSTPNGSTAKVTDLFPQGLRSVYKLTFSDGRVAEADIDHMWRVCVTNLNISKNPNWINLTTRQLLDILEHNQRIFIPTIESLSETSNPTSYNISPYLLGSLLSNGTLSDNIHIRCNNNDVITELSYHLADHKAGIITSDSSMLSFMITNVDQLSKHLRDYKLWNITDNEKHIPSDYLESSSPTYRFELLQGILDIAGIINDDQQILWDTVSLQLAKDVQYLVRSIGGKASIVSDNTKHTVVIEYYEAGKLFLLDHKKDRLLNQDNYNALELVDIRYIRTDYTQCIMIDSDDHLYITDDFIVTHNTTIINALVYALYDEPISDISKDGLINNINEKNMEVSLEFYKNDTLYRIKRERKVKNSNNSYIYRYNDTTQQFDDISEAGTVNQQIGNIIGLPCELFTRIAIFSDSMKSFFSLKSAEQTYFIEELFDITILSDKAENLKLQIKSQEQDLKLVQTKIESLEREHAQINNQKTKIVNHYNDWIVGQQTTISNYQQSLDKSIQDYEKAIIDTQNTIDLYKNKLASFSNDIDFDDMKNKRFKLDELTKSRNDIKMELSTLKTKILECKHSILTNSKTADKLSKELEALLLNKCPYCQQEYHKHKVSISDIQQQLKELAEDEVVLCETLESFERDQSRLDVDIKAIDSEIALLGDVLTIKQIDDLQQEPIKCQNQINLFENKLESLMSNDNEYINLINANTNQLESSKVAVNPYTELLKELDEVVLEDIDYSEVDRINNIITHQKFLLKLLTKKDSFIRKNILNKTIPFLNSRLQGYLQHIGLPHKVEFTHELNAKISIGGKTLNYGNLSAGQKARVNIALSLSFRDVLQRLRFSINVFMLDEILDHNLDNSGIMDVAKLIKQKSKEEELALYVISHKDEIHGVFDKTMTIQLQKGFSYIK